MAAGMCASSFEDEGAGEQADEADETRRALQVRPAYAYRHWVAFRSLSAVFARQTETGYGPMVTESEGWPNGRGAAWHAACQKRPASEQASRHLVLFGFGRAPLSSFPSRAAAQRPPLFAEWRPSRSRGQGAELSVLSNKRMQLASARGAVTRPDGVAPRVPRFARAAALAADPRCCPDQEAGRPS